MSSMRNAVHRRNHKERAQPLERAKWGLLEKHKDYSLRAKDHNTKKRKIKALQQKASERNEDEFYFGMMRSKTSGGVKIAQRGEDNSGGGTGAGKSLSHDVVKLMKTQDCAYLRTVLQSAKKAAARLETELALLKHGVSSDEMMFRKKTFTEDVALEPPLQEAGTVLDDLLDLEGEEEDASESDSSTTLKQPLTPVEQKKKRSVDVKSRQLLALRDRERQLTTALREVEDQRFRMNGRAGGINKNGVRFKSRPRQK